MYSIPDSSGDLDRRFIMVSLMFKRHLEGVWSSPSLVLGTRILFKSAAARYTVRET
jgi:hypothetical protein